MVRKSLKKIFVIGISLCMVISLMPALPQAVSKVQASEKDEAMELTAPDIKQFVTKADLFNAESGQTLFGLEEGDTTAMIKFGVNGNQPREWLIAGRDAEQGPVDNNLILLSTTSFGESKFGTTSSYNDSNFFTQKIFASYTDSNTNLYFSDSELNKMIETSVVNRMVDYNGTPILSYSPHSKLHLPSLDKDYYSGQKGKICVGKHMQKKNIVSLNQLNDTNGFKAYYRNNKNYGYAPFWLRTPYRNDVDKVFIADYSGINISCLTDPDHINNGGPQSIIPFCTLEATSLSFLSSADAAGRTTVDQGSLSTSDAMTIRYLGNSLGEAIVNAANTKVYVAGAEADTYLVVQAKEGTWAQKVSGDTVIESDHVILNGQKIKSFENCKIWLEKTDNERITTATLSSKANFKQVSIEKADDCHMFCNNNIESIQNKDIVKVDINEEMTPIIYTAAIGYYFPDDYFVPEVNGVTVTRNSDSQIIVSGTPSCNVVLTLPQATLKPYNIATDITSKDFGTKNEGYTTQAAQTITIRNTGSQTVSLSKNTLTSFEVSDFSQMTIDSGETTSFTVQPKANLAAGNYIEQLVVQTANNISITIPVTFKVNEAFRVTITNGDSKDLIANPTGGSGSYAYKWYAGNDLTVLSTSKSIFVNPSVTTTYKVVVSDFIEEKNVTYTITVNSRNYLVSVNNQTGYAVKGKTYTVNKLKFIVNSVASNGTGTVTCTGTTSSKNSKSLTIGNTIKIKGKTFKITKIGGKTFKNFKKLKKVTIGANVTSIDKEAFYGCKALKTITIKSKKLKKVGKNAIKNINKKATIKVPSNKVKAYKKLFMAKTGFKKSMKIKK